MIVRLRQQCKLSLTLVQASEEVRTQIENFAGTSWGRLPMISQANSSVFVGARLPECSLHPLLKNSWDTIITLASMCRHA